MQTDCPFCHAEQFVRQDAQGKWEWTCDNCQTPLVAAQCPKCGSGSIYSPKATALGRAQCRECGAVSKTADSRGCATIVGLSLSAVATGSAVAAWWVWA